MANIHTPPLFAPIKPKELKASDPVYGGTFGVPDRRNVTSYVHGATIAPVDNNRDLEGKVWDFVASFQKKLRS